MTFAAEPTSGEDMALLHFTSGTTGTQGRDSCARAPLYPLCDRQATRSICMDDVFWCTADPGWVTGTSYGIIAPLLHGVTSIVDEADFDADRWYRSCRTRA
jgi:acetyl-CoA synthetase